jgi:hypothetical protein
METTNYKWDIQNVKGKPAFEDKNGVVRENVIQSYDLVFIGEKEISNPENPEEKKIIEHKDKYTIFFDISDLSSFQDYSTITKDKLFDWGFEKIGPKLKTDIENSVKIKFREIPLPFVIFDIK